ncbi:MAG: SHOCT domain-containing protein [Clostridia bacterium]|nr:SHOCT domain-containing protein [Clostridia bacterium]
MFLFFSYAIRAENIKAYNQYVQAYSPAVNSFSSSTANALASAYIRNHNPYEDKSILTILFDEQFRYNELPGALNICSSILFIFFAFGLVLYLWNAKTTLTITDKRIYGRTAFGKRVDVPLHSINSVKTSIFKALTISTSSFSNPKFSRLKNRNKLYDILSKLIVLNQSGKEMQSVAIASSADELKKYKELLDTGIISQEEFEQKKERILKCKYFIVFQVQINLILKLSSKSTHPLFSQSTHPLFSQNVRLSMM